MDAMALCARSWTLHPNRSPGRGGSTVKKIAWLALVLVAIVPLTVAAESSLVSFEGGIGVIPVSNVAGDPNPAGTPPVGAFTFVTRNVVRGVNPGGQPWVIDGLAADVKVGGQISVEGRGLLLAGGNGIGTNGGQSVRAVLFCGPAATATAHSSGLVPLAADGDFRIHDVLTPAPPDPCDTPVLLIIRGTITPDPNTSAWFAAGIPKL
jgi:hypothetical protein